ncbi:MAG TPA: YciI family protein [Puia sp.]|nr:YciI family protein [Puia sp.]
MKEFALLFRFADMDVSKLSPQQFQEIAKKWQDWAGGIVSQGKMSSNGMRLAMEGKVLKAGGVITDGPFVEIREKLGSFIVVKAENLEEATTLAHGCPVLDQGGSVEIRPVMNYN